MDKQYHIAMEKSWCRQSEIWAKKKIPFYNFQKENEAMLDKWLKLCLEHKLPGFYTGVVLRLSFA